MEKIEVQKLNGKKKGKTKWEQSETAEKKAKRCRIEERNKNQGGKWKKQRA